MLCKRSGALLLDMCRVCEVITGMEIPEIFDFWERRGSASTHPGVYFGEGGQFGSEKFRHFVPEIAENPFHLACPPPGRVPLPGHQQLKKKIQQLLLGIAVPVMNRRTIRKISRFVH